MLATRGHPAQAAAPDPALLRQAANGLSEPDRLTRDGRTAEQPLNGNRKQARTMTEDSKARRKAERERRLQAALRENLRRRKAQARGRAAAAGDDGSQRTDAAPREPERKDV